MADRAKIQRSGKAKWTVMVYMAGDNNLDGAALRDIEEMARVGSTKDVNVLVQLDRLEDKKTRRFQITKGGGYDRDCVETFDETNTGDPKVLEDFLTWSAERYPAERYFLILWNHGSGWWEEARSRAAVRRTPDARLRRSASRSSLFCHKTDTPAPTTHRSICYDDHSGGDALDNRELKDVLARACAVIGKKIDILGMDACLMTMVEVAWQLRDSVEILVGSEIEEPNDGWPYAEIIAFLTAKPKSKTHIVAKEVVKQYIASYRDEGESVTQSAINTAATVEIVQTLNPLAAEILSDFDKNRKLIQWAWDRSPKFYDDNYLDLYAFTRKLRSKSKDRERLREKADALIATLKTGKARAILCQGKLGREVAGTKGLSIYFPADSINPAYRGLDFANDCQWAVFLERVLG
ncbi:MAG: Clostripain precursor [Syntrophaceae bacterium PtaB.Bin095]|nr:MAG: Clostripain precursor [Syntrophaceae bacterium PtaB.Bin095]